MKFGKKYHGLLYFSAGILFTVIAWEAYRHSYSLFPDKSIKPYEPKLVQLAEKSIASKDVPVSALLVYRDSIIGEGNNDVVKNNNPSGHAEINAIEAAFRKMGVANFELLDKDQLFLLTTYEPCALCRGAVEEYGIRNVVFSFPKKTQDDWADFKKDIRYHINLRESGNRRLQYDLFKRHPGFDSIAYPY